MRQNIVFGLHFLLWYSDVPNFRGRRDLQQFTVTFLNKEVFSPSSFQSKKIINHKIFRYPLPTVGCTHGDLTGHTVCQGVFTSSHTTQLHYCSQYQMKFKLSNWPLKLTILLMTTSGFYTLNGRSL